MKLRKTITVTTYEMEQAFASLVVAKGEEQPHDVAYMVRFNDDVEGVLIDLYEADD